jgi:transposase
VIHRKQPGTVEETQPNREKDMLTMDRKAKIRHAVLVEGKSQRQVAEELGHSRNTIGKMIQGSQILKYTLTEPRPSPILGPYKQLLVEWVEEDEKKPRKKRRTAKRMYDVLRNDHGYQGAESTLRWYVGQLRKKSRQKLYIPLAYEPGETAQVDFGEAEVIIAGELVTVHLFLMWLGYSSATFVQAYPAEVQEVFFAGHVAGFEFFGGVPREIWYDNLKIAVNKVLRGRNRDEQEAFISFRTHYLYQAEFCNVRAGWEKGGVEGRVGYTRRNWLIPPEEFESWSALNAYLRRQCEGELTRRLRGREGSIGQQLEEEQAHFLPLPTHAHPCCKVVPVRANTLSLVTFATNRYSVPVGHTHEKLLLRAYVDRIEISNGTEVVATHPRCWKREQDILNPHHYLPLLARRPRAFAHAKAIRQWQASWPSVFDAYYATLKQRLDMTEATRQFIAILQLCPIYTESLLAEALQQAIVGCCFTLAGVKELVRRLAEPAPPEPTSLPDYPQLAGVEVAQPNLQQFGQLLSYHGGGEG